MDAWDIVKDMLDTFHNAYANASDLSVVRAGKNLADALEEALGQP